MATGDRNFLERSFLVGAKFDEKTNNLLYYGPINAVVGQFSESLHGLDCPPLLG